MFMLCVSLYACVCVCSHCPVCASLRMCVCAPSVPQWGENEEEGGVGGGGVGGGVEKMIQGRYI